MSEALEISVQGTPNPNAAKFTFNRKVAEQGATYRDAGTAEAEWARRVLEVPGVVQVFALNNFISVNKTDEAQWSAVGPKIEQILRSAFT